jgi:hypothetical protein
MSCYVLKSRRQRESGGVGGKGGKGSNSEREMRGVKEIIVTRCEKDWLRRRGLMCNEGTKVGEVNKVRY